MEVEEKDFSSQPTERVGESTKEAHCELPEALLISLVIVGSSTGAIVGTLISKLYLYSFSPIGCGTLGCMIGSAIVCAAGHYCWKLFRKPKLTFATFKSVEKCMEKEVYAS
jgi:hypothetical protein